VIQKPSATSIGFTGIYESREHVWPDSLQGPGDTSNSSRGSRGDIHMLKPLSQSVNSSRGNNPYGGITNTGGPGNIGGGYWFPGSTDKGDAARILFYAATRYQSTLTLVNGQPTTNTQMGDLNALLHFNYQDVPDLFERRRNDTIYRGDDTQTAGDDSPFAGTNNRNAYIDHPEYVWSVFADQQNDTQLSVGPVDASGASSKTLDFGRVLKNAPLPAAQNVTLTKTGVDGTYYEVMTAGSASSSITGRYNAFTMDAAGSRVFSVGTTGATTATGLKMGTVTINNLDVTTQGGLGHGAQDANDVVNTRMAVLEPSNSSFSDAVDTNEQTIDFDVYAIGSGPPAMPFSINNLASALGTSLTAGLDLDSVSAAGDGARLSANVAAFTNLVAGGEHDFVATLDVSTGGTFATDYTFSLSDENLPGTATTSQLTLHLRGKAAIGGDANTDGAVNFNDLVALAQHYNQSTGIHWTDGDFNRDGSVNFADLVTLAHAYNTGTTFAGTVPANIATDWALAQSLVPEPTTVFAATMILGVVSRRRR
jgi:hypothetical protein